MAIIKCGICLHDCETWLSFTAQNFLFIQLPLQLYSSWLSSHILDHEIVSWSENIVIFTFNFVQYYHFIVVSKSNFHILILYCTFSVIRFTFFYHLNQYWRKNIFTFIFYTIALYCFCFILCILHFLRLYSFIYHI